MAKRVSKVPGTNNTIEIEEPDAPEVEASEKPEAATQSAPAAQTIPLPGEPGSPFGDDSQRYSGEADPALIIKARNAERVYKQHGLPMPPLGEPQAPEIESIDPTEAEIGSSDVELVVTGKYFAPGSAIVFNGGVEATTLNSDTEATTIVKPSLAGTPGVYPVLIRSAAGIESNVVDFAFTEPVVRSGKKSSDDDDDEPVAKSTKKSSKKDKDEDDEW